MTALAAPERIHRIPTGRIHQTPRPRTLPRPGPHSSWDPLSVDAEGEIPRDHDAPLTPAPVSLAPQDLSKLASILTKAIAEVLLGSRSPAQVQSWLCEDVWHVIRRRAELGRRARSGQPLPTGVRILRVHPCQIDERTCEVAVVLHDGSRVRAAALRLALHQQRWRAAAVRIG